MTDKMIPVPRELLKELLESGEVYMPLPYARKIDALLREAAQPEQAGTCPHCGSHHGDLTVAWMDGAHCATKKADEELRRDAERYRWLRNHYGLGSLHHADRHLMGVRNVKHSGAAQGLDSTIDAAIAAEKREG